MTSLGGSFSGRIAGRNFTWAVAGSLLISTTVAGCMNLNDSNAHSNRGNTLHSQGKVDEAIAEYREALRIDPNHRDARYNFGIALYDQGTLDEAIAEYRENLRINPKDSIGHYNLGIALYDQGALDEAIVEYSAWCIVFTTPSRRETAKRSEHLDAERKQR